MATQNKSTPITFVVPGQRQDALSIAGSTASRGAGVASAPSRPWPGQVKAAVRVGAQRSADNQVRLQAVPGEDVVLLHVAGGPQLLLNPETARDLMLGQGSTTRAAGVTAPDEVAVPVQLRWQGLEQAAPTRGLGSLGSVMLQGFEILTGFVREPAARFVASKVVQAVDGQVDAGVYALKRETLTALKGSGLKLAQVPASAQPMLVLLHGTFVDTVSTFGKLWTLHSQRVGELFDFYGGRVYALDHPTAGVSPIANALTLVNALPQGARLHLLSHSRGGLIAEVLARLASTPALTPKDLDFFKGADYLGQRQALQDLHTAVKAKGIRVERMLRVACPARGTLLASKRLDAYVSVLKWGIELAGVPVVPVLVDFLAEVARRRAEVKELPGIESMTPESPLLKWLNAAPEPIAGELRVVAGDLQGDSVMSWIKTLLADAFYWTDNDLVVQTRSMYGGAARQGGASFLLDQGGKVSHFNYFGNDRTVQALVGGLTQAAPTGFRTIGPLSWAGKDSSGQRAARRSAEDPRPAADRPAVFMLPGILGSNLKVDDQRIWLSLRLVGGLEKLRYAEGAADGVLPDGPVSLIYDDLMEHLAATHEVLPFGFDWRRPVEQEANRLADAVEVALDARNASGQPVRLIAHSMGGLLARTMQLERPKTWERLMKRDGARLLMLGTPNGGSWAPMQVLSGDDTFGNALAAFGSPLRDRAARQLMAEMPGFIQLQAGLTDAALKLDDRATWQSIADEDLARVRKANWWHHSAGENLEAAYEWGVPTQAVLTQAVALRRKLDAQVEDTLPKFADQLLLVVGHAKFTPDGFEWNEANGFTYLDACDGGDGRVTLRSALLPGVRTWTLDTEHGSLPEAKAAFAAFTELLISGETAQLERLAAPAPARGGARLALSGATPAVHVRSRPSRVKTTALPPESERAVFAAPGAAPEPLPTPRGAGLRVTVLNGNLAFVPQALMVGHSRALTLTGTEAAVNALLGGALRKSLDAGLYPDAPGSHQIFVNTHVNPLNPWHPPQPASVLVVGLGEEGKLTEAALAQSVRQGVIAWSQRMAESPSGAPATIELAATLLGSGGVGMNASNSARCVAQGVRDANDRLAGRGWPLVSELFLVEIYLERASDAWHGLQVLATAAPGRFEVTPTIQSGTGPLRRQVDSGYRGTDYDFIRALSPSADKISFALDTKRARTEVRAQSTQGKLLRDLVTRASTGTAQDPRLGRTLFQLLVPTEVEPFLAGSNRVLLELDDATATIPWELLDTRGDNIAASDDRPWAIRTQLLRKLQKETFRQQVQDASSDDSVLVIGEPQVNPEVYPALPGARAEALAVVAALTGPGGLDASRMKALVDNNDAPSVINGLFERRYRIVHVAAHGEPVKLDADGQRISNGGVVLSDDTFLGADEIRAMRTVPELVFVNCCHLAARDIRQTLRPLNRAEFAWGLADSLIEAGVRCVIAAGWAVDDRPAEVFATTFYREILNRKPFITAVAIAREAAWNEDRHSPTWAAYQAYGDPNWTYRRDEGQAASAPLAPRDEFNGVASALGLSLALEELAVQSRWMHAEPADQLEKIRHLEARFAGTWGAMGAVAEAFGVAYAEAGEVEAAIRWYTLAVNANDASATMRAPEQLNNLRARRAWTRASKIDATDRAATKAARAEIQAALNGLKAMAELTPTAEKLSLCGSGFKRLAQLEERAGDAASAEQALQNAMQAYAQGEALARERDSADLFYPALNRMALEVRLNAGNGSWAGLSDESTEPVRASLNRRNAANPDFWSMVGQIEIELLAALARRKLSGSADFLMQEFSRLHDRVESVGMWASVAEQAAFVLGPLAAQKRGDEAQAAQALLEKLQGYAAA